MLTAWLVYSQVFSPNDPRLIRRLEEFVAQQRTPKEWFEFEMLYGIRVGEQLRLANAGYPVRTLISYGEFWFPWYMRRLAERPANVLLVAKNMFSI